MRARARLKALERRWAPTDRPVGILWVLPPDARYGGGEREYGLSLEGEGAPPIRGVPAWACDALNAEALRLSRSAGGGYGVVTVITADEREVWARVGATAYRVTPEYCRPLTPDDAHEVLVQLGELDPEPVAPVPVPESALTDTKKEGEPTMERPNGRRAVKRRSWP